MTTSAAADVQPAGPGDAARRDWLRHAEDRAVERRDAPGALPETPFVLPRAVVEHVHEVVTALARGAAAVVRLRHGGSVAAMARAVGRSPVQIAQLGSGPLGRWPPTVYRPDLHLHPDGTVSVFEPNFTTAVGGLAEHDALVEHLARHPAPVRPAGCAGPGTRRVAEALRARQGPGAPGIVVVSDWREYLVRVEGHAAQAHALVRSLRGHGLRAVLAATEDLVLGDDVRHAPTGDRVDVVYRFFDEQGEDSPRAPQLLRLVELADRGQVALVDGLVGQLALTKAVLADLSDPRLLGQLPRRDAELLAASVPWTRRLAEGHTRGPDGSTLDLLPHTVRRQQDLLVKPADGYGGAGVTFGAEVSAGEWSSTIDAAVADPAVWVVQQVVDTRSDDRASWGDGASTVPGQRADFGAYVVDGALAAMVRRTTWGSEDRRLVKGGGMAPVVTEAAAWG